LSEMGLVHGRRFTPCGGTEQRPAARPRLGRGGPEAAKLRAALLQSCATVQLD